MPREELPAAGIGIERERTEALTALENASYLISQRKILILATYLGFKPLSLIDADIEEGEDEEAIREEIQAIARGLNLYVEELGTHPYQGEVVGKEIEYAIAKRKESIENFRARIEQDPTLDSKDYDQVFGALMGFPQSSVSAYVRNDGMDFGDARALLTEEQDKFLFFRLSKTSWEEEVAWLQQIIDGIKRISPKIYDEVMQVKRRR